MHRRQVLLFLCMHGGAAQATPHACLPAARHKAAAVSGQAKPFDRRKVSFVRARRRCLFCSLLKAAIDTLLIDRSCTSCLQDSLHSHRLRLFSCANLHTWLMLAAQKSALKRREEVTRYVMDDRIVYYIANLHIKTVALRECNC
jgi:hypothetical protein